MGVVDIAVRLCLGEGDYPIFCTDSASVWSNAMELKGRRQLTPSTSLFDSTI